MPCLLQHPAIDTRAVTLLEAEAVRSEAGLTLRFRLEGALEQIRLPPPVKPARADELWRHSCFEAFVRTPGPGGYVELNFAPSRQWAVYGFDGYRSGMRDAPVPQPEVEVLRNHGCFALTARVDLPELPPNEPWHVNLTAVIQERSGTRSYWALRHPAGDPDFHDPHCFVLELPPPTAP